MRMTHHNGRTRADGSAFSTKHNDRNGFTADHINPDPEHDNFYRIINPTTQKPQKLGEDGKPKKALTSTKEIAMKNYSVNPLLPKINATQKAVMQNAARPSTNIAEVPALARKKLLFSSETAAAQSALKLYRCSFHSTFPK